MWDRQIILHPEPQNRQSRKRQHNSDVVNQLKDAGLNANFDAGNRRFYLSSSDSGYATDFNITADSSDTNSTTLLNALGLGKTAKKMTEAMRLLF